MEGVKNKLKIVAKYRDEFTICMDSLGKLILERIAAEHAQTKISLALFEDEDFVIALETILQLPETFSFEEKLVLLLAITPHVRPGFLEEVMARALPQGGEFSAFGGIKGQQHRGIIPTGETALFLLAGMDTRERLNYQKLFSSDGLFAIHGMLQVDGAPPGEPAMSGRLMPDPDWLQKILLGKEAAPVYSVEFPARKITTNMLWDDLVLHPQTSDQINDIQVWMSYHQKVLQDPVFGRRIKPGYRVLFHGKAGTGKTTTASLL
ncbi:MAG TPA: hypothetical protein VKN36_00245, partial [Eudoraea sp.]|nr:hypothetical protein [Eudoraea sp.]